MEQRLSFRKTNRFMLVNLVTAGVIGAWFAVACFAIIYLTSH